MSSRDDELMVPSNWDRDSITTHAPDNSPKSVISVKFESAELAEIAQVARENDLMITTFIRLATLAWCRGYEKLESE